MEGIQRYLCETKAACYQAFQTQKGRLETVSKKISTIAGPYFSQLKSETTKIYLAFKSGRATGNLPFKLAIVTAIISFQFGVVVGGFVSPKLAQLVLLSILVGIIFRMASPQSGEGSQPTT